MSIHSLLTEEVTIRRHAPGAQNDYGNTADAWTADASPVKCRLEQRSAEERTFGRDTQISDWVLYLHRDVVIGGRDRVSDGYGRVFEVVGPATMRTTPRGPHHVEVSLRHVEGG